MSKTIQVLSFLIVLIASSAQAAPSCRQLILGGSRDVIINAEEQITKPTELNLISKTFEASNDRKQVSTEVSDVVNMLAQARGPIISDKEINEKGKIVLGLGIGSGFSLELKYKHMIHETEGEIYVLDHINMYTPSGKQMDISSNPIDPYDIRKLAVNRSNFEIGTYPDGFNITAKVATIIKGDVLKEIKELAPKLELLPKDIIRDISKESNLNLLKKKANRAYMKYFIKRYSIRGVFKTLFKLVIYEPIKTFIAVGVAMIYLGSHEPGALNSMKETFLPTTNKVEWVSHSLQETAGSGKMPVKVKDLLNTLRTDIENKQVTIDANSNNIAMDQNSSRLQMSREDYMWTTTITDKATGKSMSLIFISHDNKKGQISYVAFQVDPVKYKDLIDYIKSIGQFIQVSEEDLK